MLRKVLAAVFCIGLCLSLAVADEFKGKVKSVDPDKNTITVTIDGEDKTFKVNDDTKIVRKGKDGDKDVKDGLKNEKAWKRGPNVIVTTEGDSPKGKVKEIRIVGGKKKKQDQ